MRIYYDIRLSDRNITKRELEGEAIVKAGRYFIAKTLLELGAATVDPLSPANPLIFSAGPFAGTSFSNANRTSVGCKSPLTGGVKERTREAPSALRWASRHRRSTLLVQLRVGRPPHHQDGRSLRRAHPTWARATTKPLRSCLRTTARKSASSGGPVGEHGPIGHRLRRHRWAASRSWRGGVGAVMGSKKVKAIVVDLHKMPTFHDRKKVMGAIREYGADWGEPAIDVFTVGTAMMGDS
jgi:aldehyde:ferredoxin oxidoreductase